MALGRNQRLDPRRASPYCSTTTIVVFVALCLVGVWMMTSSTVVPADISPSDTKSELKQEVSKTDANISEDSKVDIPEEAKKGDTSINANTGTSESNSESSEKKTQPEVTIEKGEGATQRENEVKEDGDTKQGDDNSNTANNEPEKSTEKNSDQSNKKEQETNTANNELGGTAPDENSSKENNQQEKKAEQTSYQAQNNEEKSQDQDKIDQNSDQTQGPQDQDKTDQNSDQTQNNEEKTQDQDKTDQNSDQTQNNEEKTQHQDKTDQNSDQTQNNEDKTQDQDKTDDQIQKVEQNQERDTQTNSYEEKTGGPEKQGSGELLPSGGQSEVLNETNAQNGAWSTQAAESKNEKEVQASSSSKEKGVSLSWKLCHVTTGADYIPCLDNEAAIKKLTSRGHFEHRERHCPETPPTCLVPLPEGYKRPVEWPNSRNKIWYRNVPYTGLATYKGHQNWVKVSGEYITFPGGGTQFIHGALHYIDVIQQALPDIAWGKRSRVVLDVGCGVASFGGYLFDRDVITMSFAPKDEHEAQVQFALERGIPAVNNVMGTKRLPFPGRVFDVIHCARCRVPWHNEGGKLLLELNRLLRPGGYFVWSATPVYRKDQEDAEIWNAMKALTKSMCWKMVVKTKDETDGVGIAIYKKPSKNACYEKRKESNPPLCQESDDPNAAWNIPLQTCMHKLPEDPSVRGTWWPEQWLLRLEKPPYWLNSSQVGVYGKAAPEDFKADQEHWNLVVTKSYRNGMGIDWSKVRNVMDMRAVYGGFAAALRDMKLWVMNIVPIDSPDTLPIIYERGLFGMYHDWCEAHSTYPRTYDLLHADHLFSSVKKRCNLLPVIVEVDRILRPEGKLIVRDSVEVINEVESIARSLNYEIRMTFSKQNEGILCVMKTMWRPNEVEGST